MQSLLSHVRSGSFRGKPSKVHIIWTRQTRAGASRKRFDEEHFERWVRHCGFEFENATRVDHDRSTEPRQQYRCVFSWGQISGETLELGDDQWTLGPQKTPRTFIEIDSEGVARVKGWTFEDVIDVVEMKHKGPELLIRTEAGDKKRLNGRKFVSDPRKRQREGKEGASGDTSDRTE